MQQPPLQTSNPSHVDNATFIGICNHTVKHQVSRATVMRNFWGVYQVDNGHWRIIWYPGNIYFLSMSPNTTLHNNVVNEDQYILSKITLHWHYNYTLPPVSLTGVLNLSLILTNTMSYFHLKTSGNISFMIPVVWPLFHQSQIYFKPDFNRPMYLQ